jgi:hypothetical protein
MDNQVLIYVMAGAVVVSAIALVVQMLVLFGLYRSGRAVEQKAIPLLQSAGQAIDSASREFAATREEIRELAAKLNAVLDNSKVQIEKIDVTLTEMTTRARNQMDRVELVLDDSLDRIQHAVTVVHNGVVKPVQQVNGLAVGIGTALHYFFRGGRPNVSEATMDEEMFI